MPYIRVATSQNWTEQQMNDLKAGLAAATTLIPGKTEAALMIELDHGRDMYFQGIKRELAYVDAKFSGCIELEYKQHFTVAVFQLLKEVCQLADDAVYVTCSEFDSWGTRGELKMRK
ncbi:MAG: hypothetical protein IJB55_00490 [Firmicutes bacterium]|nr:hypothetical protein [Bacillota bacterium]